MKILNNIILNTIEVVLSFFQLSYGYDKVYNTQTVYYNENDKFNVKVSFQNVPNNVTPKLFFSNHNELPNLEFQLALNRGMNGTAIYAFFIDGDINNSAKVLELIHNKTQISQDNRHACLKKSKCEIVISEWHKKNRKYYEKQTIEYNLYDDVNVLITLLNEPLDVTKRDLRQTGTIVLENVNSTILYNTVLTEQLSEMNLYVEAYNAVGDFCYKETVIMYKYLANQIIPSAERHACLSSCEIIIDLHEGHKYCNGKKIEIKDIDKKDQPSKEIDTKDINKKDPPKKAYTVLVSCVVGSLCFIILIIIFYVCITHIKKSRSNLNEEAYTYVSQNQLVYTQPQFDSQNFELPRTTNTTIYSRIIGILKQK